MFDPVLNIKIAVKSTVEKVLGGNLDLVAAVLAYLYRHCFTMREPAECTVEAICNGIRLMTGRKITAAYVRQILAKLREIGIVESQETRLAEGNTLSKVNIWKPKPLREVQRRLTELLDQIRKGTEDATNEIMTKLIAATTEQ